MFADIQFGSPQKSQFQKQLHKLRETYVQAYFEGTDLAGPSQNLENFYRQHKPDAWNDFYSQDMQEVHIQLEQYLNASKNKKTVVSRVWNDRDHLLGFNEVNFFRQLEEPDPEYVAAAGKEAIQKFIKNALSQKPAEQVAKEFEGTHFVSLTDGTQAVQHAEIVKAVRNIRNYVAGLPLNKSAQHMQAGVS